MKLNEKSSYLLEMTWEQFHSTITPSTVVVIPIGSVELEGTHLPLGVDTIAAEGVARHLTSEDNVLIGPTIPVGYSKWFNPFPGTISFEHNTLTQVCLEYCISIIKHGIKRIVFLNGHRGNNSCIEATSHSLILRYAVRIGMLNIWKLANDLTKESGLIKEGKFTHAGEIMTSVILALKPDTVLAERIKPGSVRSPNNSAFVVRNSVGETALQGSVQMVYQDIRDVTETGVLGDPTNASLKKGQVILELIADYTKQYLNEFKKLPIKKRVLNSTIG